MEVRNVFAHVLFANFAILESDCSWIGAVVKTSFDPISSQKVVAILSHFVAKQFNDEYSKIAIVRFEA